MFRRQKPAPPDWWDLASWQASLEHFDQVWAARFETLSLRLRVVEDSLGNPPPGPEIERV